MRLPLIDIDEITPIKFHPYTSIVMDRVLVIDCGVTVDEGYQEIHRFELALIELFQNAGSNCRVDNKIAFECKICERTVFYGFKDNRFSIGFSVKRTC